MTEHERSVLRATDGHEIHVQIWRPAGEVTHVIQIVHGLGEHADRYGRFAAAANARGCVVCCHDHRGHGSNSDNLGWFGNKDGWELITGDVQTVNLHLAARFADLPLVLLGHSMGSYIAQYFLMQYGGNWSGLILSASTWPSRAELFVFYALTRFEVWRLGGHRNSALLNKLGFGNFNKAFEPARTVSDWLSRDDVEVDRYVADPLCGGPYTSSLWRDLTIGLFKVSTDKALSKIPADLPILITGGELDPVGGEKRMSQLAMHYARSGHQRLRVMIYPGGRHEMLNDVVRDEVTKDWLDWIVATSRSAR